MLGIIPRGFGENTSSTQSTCPIPIHVLINPLPPSHTVRHTGLPKVFFLVQFQEYFQFSWSHSLNSTFNATLQEQEQIIILVQKWVDQEQARTFHTILHDQKRYITLTQKWFWSIVGTRSLCLICLTKPSDTQIGTSSLFHHFICSFWKLHLSKESRHFN